MTGPGPADPKQTRAARGSATPAAAATDPGAVPTAPPTGEATPPTAIPAEAAARKAKAPRSAAKTAPAARVPAAKAAPAITAARAPAAEVPPPPPPTVVAPVPAAPPDTGPGAPAAAPAGRSTPDVAAAVDKAFDRLRSHLTMGEIVAGLGALIILVIAWATFGFLFGHGGTWPSELVLLLCVSLLAILVLQNGRVHDFGPNHRLLVTGLCLALGFLAGVEILRMIRDLVDGARLEIGGLTWWAGAVVAVLGGWMVWREPR